MFIETPEQEFRRQLAYLIATSRKNRGFQQQEIAKMMGVSFKTVSAWETGRSQPPLNKLFKLSEILDYHIQNLIPRSNRRKDTLLEEAMIADDYKEKHTEKK